MKRWKGPIKATYLELPDDLHKEMRALGLRTGRKAAEVYAEAADCLLHGIIHRDNRPHVANENAATLDGAVLELLSTHANDPRCRECIEAIARIWRVGDYEITDAITRNCRVFARASEALEGLGSDARPRGTGDHEGRVGALLEHEARIEPAIDNPPEADRATGTSGRSLPRVGKKPIRKSNHG